MLFDLDKTRAAFWFRKALLQVYLGRPNLHLPALWNGKQTGSAFPHNENAIITSLPSDSKLLSQTLREGSSQQNKKNKIHMTQMFQKSFVYFIIIIIIEVAGSIPGTSTSFKCGLGLERGPPSLVRTIG